MARSLKKGPYVEDSLQKKIDKMNENSEKKDRYLKHIQQYKHPKQNDN